MRRADGHGVARHVAAQDEPGEPAPGEDADARVAEFAKENVADLLVVASPDRGTLDRLWHGSVSRGAVHLATTNVACVPLPKNP